MFLPALALGTCGLRATSRMDIGSRNVGTRWAYRVMAASASIGTNIGTAIAGGIGIVATGTAATGITTAGRVHS